MSQQRQTQQETGESSTQTTDVQRTLMQNGRKAMRQFVELPLQQSLQFQRSAAELFVNGLEAQKWAQERGIELTKDTMGSYLQTLDDVTQNAEELARTEMAAGQTQGQAIQQAMDQFQGGQEMQGQPPAGRQMGGQQMSGQQPSADQPMTGQGMGGQQPIPQQPPQMGQQAPAGGFQQPQGPQPQGISQQPPQRQNIGQQPPQRQEVGQQPPQRQETRQQQSQPQIQGLQRSLGQQPSPQQQPTPQNGKRQTETELAEATQRDSRSEGPQAEGRTQKESPAETN